MKSLSNYLKIMPLNNYESINGNDLIGTIDQLFIKTTNDLEVEEKPNKKSGGRFIDQYMKAVSSVLSESDKKTYPAAIPVMVLLFTDDGTPVLWGGEEQKLRLTITSRPDCYIFEFKRQTTTTLF